MLSPQVHECFLLRRLSSKTTILAAPRKPNGHSFLFLIHLSVLLFRQDRVYPDEYRGHFQLCVLKYEDIVQVVKALAQKIHEDYKGRRPVFLCTLKGANPVSSNQCGLEKFSTILNGTKYFITGQLITFFFSPFFTYFSVLSKPSRSAAGAPTRLLCGIFARVVL